VLYLAMVFATSCAGARHSATVIGGGSERQPAPVEIAALVRDAETARIAGTIGSSRDGSPETLDGWVNIVVEPLAASAVAGFRFHRAYNTVVDPAWIYVVATDGQGGVYRIGGFGTEVGANEYSRLVRRWFERSKEMNDGAILDIVASYFRHVEGWSQGVVRGSGDARRLPATARACAKPRITRRRADEVFVNVVLYDVVSGGLQCAEVELSAEHGFVVASRVVIAEGTRIEL
jgi:hypothetical protein